MSGSENSTSPNLNSSSEGETLLTEGHAELALENLSRVERPLLLLGVGRTARALVAYIRGGLAQPENFSCGVIYGTTREEGRAAELKELDEFPTPDAAPDFYVDYGETGPYVAETGESECAT